jgi:hypothetical protein
MKNKAYLQSVYADYEKQFSSYIKDSKMEEDKSENPDESDAKMDPEDLDKFVSDLERGDIAVPRNHFPYLIFPRNVYVYLSHEERDRLKYIPVHYDNELDECYLSVEFKEVEKFIPFKIFKVIFIAPQLHFHPIVVFISLKFSHICSIYHQPSLFT